MEVLEYELFYFDPLILQTSRGAGGRHSWNDIQVVVFLPIKSDEFPKVQLR